jgi:hypothetical protein
VQPFLMTSKMTTIQGVFYPKGYAFVMFPNAEIAEEAAQKIEQAGFSDQHVMLLTPAVILREIGRIDGENSVELPSVGTEGATVHKYINLAREGHHALMVRAPSDDDAERLMTVVREFPFSYAQKYHMLAIEDLE